MTTTNNAPISFRLTDDELELLRQHQEDGEKSLNLTAKRLLLNALGVDAKKPSIQVVNSVDMVQVQELIETAVQEKLEKLTIVDNVDILKKLIDESLADGGIGEATATSCTQATTNLNSTREEFYSKLEELTQPTHDHSEIINTARDGYNQLSQMVHDLQLQINELKGIPALPAKSLIGSSFEQSVINLVPIGRLIGAYGESPIDGSECGEIYTKKYLIDHELLFHLRNHQQEVEQKLKIKLSLDNENFAVREINKILKALGYELGNKQINKVEHYWVTNPQK